MEALLTTLVEGLQVCLTSLYYVERVLRQLLHNNTSILHNYVLAVKDSLKPGPCTPLGYTRVAGNHKGMLTRSRQPKMAAHILRQRYLSDRDICRGAQKNDSSVGPAAALYSALLHSYQLDSAL